MPKLAEQALQWLREDNMSSSAFSHCVCVCDERGREAPRKGGRDREMGGRKGEGGGEGGEGKCARGNIYVHVCMANFQSQQAFPLPATCMPVRGRCSCKGRSCTSRWWYLHRWCRPVGASPEGTQMVVLPNGESSKASRDCSDKLYWFGCWRSSFWKGLLSYIRGG